MKFRFISHTPPNSMSSEAGVNYACIYSLISAIIEKIDEVGNCESLLLQKNIKEALGIVDEKINEDQLKIFVKMAENAEVVITHSTTLDKFGDNLQDAIELVVDFLNPSNAEWFLRWKIIMGGHQQILESNLDIR